MPERALGAECPPTYRVFVALLGAGSFEIGDIYGVIDDNFTDSSVPNGVWYTLRARRSWRLPHDLIVISNDGMGGDYSLDTSRRDDSNERPVVVWHAGTDDGG